MKNYKVNTALVWGCAVLVSGLSSHGALALETCESRCAEENPVFLIEEPCMIENFLKNPGGADIARHNNICGLLLNENCVYLSTDEQGSNAHPVGWLSDDTMEVIVEDLCDGVEEVGNLDNGNQIINLGGVCTAGDGDSLAHQLIGFPKIFLVTTLTTGL